MESTGGRVQRAPSNRSGGPEARIVGDRSAVVEYRDCYAATMGLEPAVIDGVAANQFGADARLVSPSDTP